jgi:hypothetical protein
MGVSSFCRDHIRPREVCMGIIIMILVLCGEPTGIMVSEGDQIQLYDYNIPSVVHVLSEYGDTEVSVTEVPLNHILEGMCV